MLGFVSVDLIWKWESFEGGRVLFIHKREEPHPKPQDGSIVGLLAVFA